MTSSGLSFVGRQIQGSRPYQEDEFGFLDGQEMEANGGGAALLVLADGMGGHVGGATASKIVVNSVIDAYSKCDGLVTDRLRDTLTAANIAIGDTVQDKPELDGMGCTLVAAVVSAEGLEWISVGDSPMWLYREPSLRRLNADHSMAPVFEQLVKVGRMTAEEAATDKKRNALRSAIVGEELTLVDVSSQPVKLQPNDIVVLASDGVETLDEQEIGTALVDVGQSGLEAAAEHLLSLVEAAGKPNQDNTTLLLCLVASDTTGAAFPLEEEEETRTLIYPQSKSSSARNRKSPRPRVVKWLAILILAAGAALGIAYHERIFGVSVSEQQSGA